MLSGKIACEIARRLPSVSEKDHFGSDAFYANKRIFATVWHSKNQVNVRLSPDQQRSFLEMDGEALVEIPNAWGGQGWTTVCLEFVERQLFTEVLKAAWETSAVKFSRTPRKTSANQRKSPKSQAKKKRKTKTRFSPSLEPFRITRGDFTEASDRSGNGLDQVWKPGAPCLKTCLHWVCSTI